MKRIVTFTAILMALAACKASQTQPTPETVATDIPQAEVELSNHASVYCEQNGYEHEIPIAEDGSQGEIKPMKGGSMKKRMTWVLVVAAVGLLVGTAFAQFAKTEDAVKYRQSVMSVIGTNFTRMGAVVKGEAPYAKEAFEQNANVVATLIPLPWDAFMVAGSDKGSGMKADALAKKDDFMKLATANQAEVAKLLAAAKSGDLSAIKPQFGTTGGSCKACHDAYRNK